MQWAGTSAQDGDEHFSSDVATSSRQGISRRDGRKSQGGRFSIFSNLFSKDSKIAPTTSAKPVLKYPPAPQKNQLPSDAKRSIPPSLYSDPAFSPDPYAHPYVVTSHSPISGAPPPSASGYFDSKPAFQKDFASLASPFPYSPSSPDEPFLRQPPNSPMTEDDTDSHTFLSSKSYLPTRLAVANPSETLYVLTPAGMGTVHSSLPPSEKQEALAVLQQRPRTGPPIITQDITAFQGSDSPPSYETVTDELMTRPSPARITSAPDMYQPEDRPELPARPATTIPQPSRRARAERVAKPQAQQLQRLDSIDELDETNPLGLPVHHDGPYEAIPKPIQRKGVSRADGANGQRQPSRATSSSQSLSHNRDPEAPTYIPLDAPLNIEPGQLFPRNYQTYLPPTQTPHLPNMPNNSRSPANQLQPPRHQHSFSSGSLNPNIQTSQQQPLRRHRTTPAPGDNDAAYGGLTEETAERSTSHSQSSATNSSQSSQPPRRHHAQRNIDPRIAEGGTPSYAPVNLGNENASPAQIYAQDAVGRQPPAVRAAATPGPFYQAQPLDAYHTSTPMMHTNQGGRSGQSRPQVAQPTVGDTPGYVSSDILRMGPPDRRHYMQHQSLQQNTDPVPYQVPAELLADSPDRRQGRQHQVPQQRVGNTPYQGPSNLPQAGSSDRRQSKQQTAANTPYQGPSELPPSVSPDRSQSRQQSRQQMVGNTPLQIPPSLPTTDRADRRQNSQPSPQLFGDTPAQVPIALPQGRSSIEREQQRPLRDLPHSRNSPIDNVALQSNASLLQRPPSIQPSFATSATTRNGPQPLHRPKNLVMPTPLQPSMMAGREAQPLPPSQNVYAVQQHQTNLQPHPNPSRIKSPPGRAVNMDLRSASAPAATQMQGPLMVPESQAPKVLKKRASVLAKAPPPPNVTAVTFSANLEHLPRFEPPPSRPSQFRPPPPPVARAKSQKKRVLSKRRVDA